MFCPKCIKNITDGINFCPYCGYQLNSQIIRFSCVEDLERVDELLERKRYNELLDSALNGNVYAKYLYIGHVVNQSRTWFQDRTAEYDRLKSLAEQKDSFAMAALGISLYYANRPKGTFESITEGMKCDKKEMDRGVGLLIESMNAGEAAAQYYIGNWHVWGTIDNIKKDDAKAYKLMNASAEQEYPLALSTLGMWHYEGTNGARKDIEKGYTLLEKAALYRVKDAVDFFEKRDKRWFSLSLYDALNQNLIEKGKNILSEKTICGNKEPIVKKSKSQEERELAEKKEKSLIKNAVVMCTTSTSIEECVKVYKQLEDTEFYIVDPQKTLDGIKAKIDGFAQVSGETVDETLILKDQLDAAHAEIDTYSTLQDYEKLKDWMISQNMNKKVVKVAFEYGNKKLAEKYGSEIQKYKEYDAKKPSSVLSTIVGCFIIYIIAEIVGAFFPIARIIGWVLVAGGVLSIFAEWKVRSYKKTYKKFKRLKESGYTFE